MTTPILPDWQAGATLYAVQLLQLNTAITNAQVTADAALAASGVAAGRNSIGLASAVPQALSYVAFGDSITAGYAASSAATTYVGLVGAALGVVPTNYGVSGSQAAEQGPLIYPNFTPSTTGSQLVTLMVGTNDCYWYNANYYKQNSFRLLHLALAAYLGTPKKLKGQSSQIAYSGAWANSAKYGGAMGKETSAASATATFTMLGTTCYVAYTMENSNAATFSIAVDGLTVGSYTVAPEGGVTITTQLGATYGSACIRLSNFADARHTVVITKTNGTGLFTLDWVASAAGQATPDGVTVVVGGIPRATGQDPNLAIFSAMVRENVARLGGDGLAVSYADTPNYLLPPSDVIEDNVHPNDTGMSHLKDAFMAAIGSQARAGVFKRAAVVKLPDLLGDNVVRGSNVTVTTQAYAGTVSGGDGHTLNTAYNTVLGGRFNTAEGFWSTVGGFSSYAGGVYGVALGAQANDRAQVGVEAYASGAFALTGDAQVTRRVLRIFTNNATAARLTSDGTAPAAGNTVNLPDNSTYVLSFWVVARNIGAAGNSAYWQGQVMLRRLSGVASTVFVGGKRESSTTAQAAITAGTPFAPTINDSGAAAWRVTIGADTTWGGLALSGTGDLGTNTIWTAGVHGIELVG